MEASVATAAGQGAPTPAAQPAAAGQGQGAGSPTAGSQGDGQFNWGNFPDVPEAERAALEPHLRNVQGHVTRIEQQFAPYRGITDAVAPEQVENVVGFLNAYNADPPGTVLGMVQQAIEDGSITAEQVQQLSGQQVPAGGQQAQPGQEDMPQWARELQAENQRLQGKFSQQEATQQQEAQAKAEADNDAALEQAKTGIRTQLTDGGISAEAVPDNIIVAAIIANNGDEAAAAQSLLTMRTALLGEFTQTKTPPGGKKPAQQGKLPASKQGSRRRGDGFDGARQGAEQMLAQRMANAASG
jgi:hypothetical protein